MEEKVKKINEDELLVTLTTDELASLSEAIAFCESNNYSKIEDLKISLNKFTIGLYKALVWIEDDFVPNNITKKDRL